MFVVTQAPLTEGGKSQSTTGMAGTHCSGTETFGQLLGRTRALLGMSPAKWLCDLVARSPPSLCLTCELP